MWTTPIIDLIQVDGVWMTPWDAEDYKVRDKGPVVGTADTVDSKSAPSNGVEVRILSGPPLLEMDGDAEEKPS